LRFNLRSVMRGPSSKTTNKMTKRIVLYNSFLTKFSFILTSLSRGAEPCRQLRSPTQSNPEPILGRNVIAVTIDAASSSEPGNIGILQTGEATGPVGVGILRSVGQKHVWTNQLTQCSPADPRR
jgi:hypothetical protein